MSAASRHAPALRCEVLTQPALQLAVAFLAGLAAAALWAALSAHGLVSGAWPALFLPAAAALAWRAARVRPRLLLWDGQCWRLQTGSASAPAGPQAVRLRVVFDFDHWLLLRVQVLEPDLPFWPDMRRKLAPVYLPLSRRRQGAVWPALRATLFAARVKLPTTPSGDESGGA